MAEAEPSERQRENAELVRDGFDAFDAGDLEATLGFLHPEVEVYNAPELINAGTYHGHAGFISWAGGWLEAWESFENAVEGVHAVGEDHVVVDVHQTGRGAGSGIEIEQDVAFLFEVDGGKAVRVQLYADRETALEAAKRLGAEPDA